MIDIVLNRECRIVGISITPNPSPPYMQYFFSISLRDSVYTCLPIHWQCDDEKQACQRAELYYGHNEYLMCPLDKASYDKAMEPLILEWARKAEEEDRVMRRSTPSSSDKC